MFRWTGQSLVVLALLVVAPAALLVSPALAADVVGRTTAELRWSAASGPVVGYQLFVSRNGGGFTATTTVAGTQAMVSGAYGDTVQLQVAAFDASGNLGPRSAASEPIRFVEAPEPPGGGGGGGGGGNPVPPVVENPLSGFWRDLVRVDFDGNGQTDVLWRNDSTGSARVWLMDGGTRVGSFVLPFLGRFSIAGAGDFDRDGRGDVLLHDAETGQTRIWFTHGQGLDEAVDGPDDPGENWDVVSCADFDGDGRTDVLWRDATAGQTTLWLMEGASIRRSQLLNDLDDTFWRVVGAGDYNGDGRADILWRNAFTGKNLMWEMRGTTVTGQQTFRPLYDTQWVPVASADFDGDGTDDLLWRNFRTLEMQVWMMDSGTAARGGPMIGRARSWSVVGVGDYDADGLTDILWRRANGGMEIWNMDERIFVADAPATSEPNEDWIVVGP
ncbi:MAG: VCBS repeat-containing protein [Proteobacteria bacterium]|nr:VCBS repeat-containing protein [Pseudomonadota bacterium]